GSRRDLVFGEARASRPDHARRDEHGSDGEEKSDRACLALSITDSGIEVALRVPPGGLNGLRSYLATPERSLALTTALESLPEQFTLGLVREPGRGSVADEGRVPATRVAIDAIRALLDVALREQAAIWLGWVVPGDLALAHAEVIDGQLEDALVALGCVLALIASRPPDRASSVRVPAAEKARHHHARADDDGGAEPKRRMARQRDRDREVRPEREVLSEAAVDRELGAPRASRPSHRNAATSLGPRRHVVRASLAARRPFEIGARVRVLDGPFAGKAGVVQELDGKDGARVMLGLLAVRLHVKDLARCVEGRDRPVLSSSHRKPLPARS
ncbi:MAG: KOW motif-containing protein, partial [Myxococcota bacterium]|nr:KOW motif-containing protein [Myxococcota bacterium]